MSEPLYIELRLYVRVRTEGAAMFFTILMTSFGFVFALSERALVAFAAGQAAYAFFVFWNFCGRSTPYILRRRTVEDHGQ